ncbi:hypothetical protein MK131_15260 [Candidatus Poribacteria bacterium]|nr:hypothetical protein [Candidatus Poribacteria bacterium]
MLLTILRSIQVIGLIIAVGGYLLDFTSEEEVVILGLSLDRFSGIGMTISGIAFLAYYRLNKKPDDIPMGNRSDFE